MRYVTLAPERYSPLYYLSSVGAGGLAVSFFMYLLWLTPHPDQPIPSFATLSAAFFKGNPAMQALIIASLLAILFFGFLHFRLLAWNAKHDIAWRKTDAFKAFQSGNAESQLMALPLTLAMSVNVLFIAGALFVPGLWEQAEWLFPLAVAAFGAIGYLAVKTFASFMARVLTKGGFDCAKNNGLGQMLPVFTFAMVAVGFSATVAMSQTKWLVVIAYLGAAFFLMATLVFGTVFLVLGFRAMMEHKIAEENAATLWILIPILTVVGIALYRMNKGLNTISGSNGMQLVRSRSLPSSSACNWFSQSSAVQSLRQMAISTSTCMEMPVLQAPMRWSARVSPCLSWVRSCSIRDFSASASSANFHGPTLCSLQCLPRSSSLRSPAI